MAINYELYTAYTNQFSANIKLGLQQANSRFRDAVRVESINGEYDFFDQIEATEAIEITTRFADTPLIESPMTRRRVGTSMCVHAELIEKEDKIKMLADPTNIITQNTLAAMFRKMDSKLITAFDATAYTGKAGGTSTTFTSDNIVAVTIGATAATGLNVAKLRAAAMILNANEVPPEDRFIAVSAKQLNDMLGQTEVTSADYNSVRALVDGSLDTFLGFKFISSERLGTDSSSYRKVPVWSRNGLLLAIGEEPTVRLDERPDKNYATQVFVSMNIGATRMDEKMCVEILCSES